MNIDWELLAEQKEVLVKMRAELQDELVLRPGRPEEVPALSGIIHLLDGLQDEHEAGKDDKSKFLRKACQAAYVLDYDSYCRVLRIPQDYYAKGKWGEMSRDFIRWYCSLDVSTAKIFVNYVEER